MNEFQLDLVSKSFSSLSIHFSLFLKLVGKQKKEKGYENQLFFDGILFIHSLIDKIIRFMHAQ